MACAISTGDLLVAPPTMPDPRFTNTVLLVTHHGHRASQALCLNKPSEHRLSEIINPLALDLEQDPLLYWGGPIAPNTVWMLHDPGWTTEGTVVINDEWSMTSHMQMFNKIAQHSWPTRFRIMFGHSTWGPGQLVKELEGVEPFDMEGSWLVVHKPNPDWLVNSSVTHLWSSACGLCGQQAVDSWMA